MKGAVSAQKGRPLKGWKPRLIDTMKAQRLNYGNKCLAKFYFKSNGRIEIFKKKIHGKEVSHDRVKPLLRLFGQGRGGGL